MPKQATPHRDATRIPASHVIVRGIQAPTTLPDLVTALQECTTDDEKLVATSASLINRARMWLGETFDRASIDMSPVADAILPLSTLCPGGTDRCCRTDAAII